MDTFFFFWMGIPFIIFFKNKGGPDFRPVFIVSFRIQEVRGRRLHAMENQTEAFLAGPSDQG
jgi:hypothetical protein